MGVLTIGFKGRSAEDFFTTLKHAVVQKITDVRRKNRSQLAGYTKRPDLIFFLKECFSIANEHVPDFGPSEQLIKEYQNRLGKKKKDDVACNYYLVKYQNEVLSQPTIDRFKQTNKEFTTMCLLCSEKTADRCHRLLLTEYFTEHIPNIKVEHI